MVFECDLVPLHQFEELCSGVYTKKHRFYITSKCTTHPPAPTTPHPSPFTLHPPPNHVGMLANIFCKICFADPADLIAGGPRFRPRPLP